jgi:hypothetical protein
MPPPFAHRATADKLFRAMTDGRRVGEATGSRECAPDDRLRVPTSRFGKSGGHGASAPLPTLQN